MGGIARSAVRGLTAASVVLALAGLSFGEASAQAKQDPAKIEGFRSAKFGMSIRDVERAIRKDFGLSGSKIEKGEDALNQRSVRSISVKDLLPDSGLSRIAYIFGYRSIKLSHINVLFGQPVDPKVDANAIVAAAQLLQGYFQNREWPPGEVILNKQLKDGSAVLFLGKDSKGRSVQLVWRELPQPAESEDKKRLVALQLSYIEKPIDPDIFKVEKGAF